MNYDRLDQTPYRKFLSDYSNTPIIIIAVHSIHNYTSNSYENNDILWNYLLVFTPKKIYYIAA